MAREPVGGSEDQTERGIHLRHQRKGTMSVAVVNGQPVGAEDAVPKTHRKQRRRWLAVGSVLVVVAAGAVLGVGLSSCCGCRAEDQRSERSTYGPARLSQAAVETSFMMARPVWSGFGTPWVRIAMR